MWNVSYERAPMSASIYYSAVTVSGRQRKEQARSVPNAVYVVHTPTVVCSNIRIPLTYKSAGALLKNERQKVATSLQQIFFFFFLKNQCFSSFPLTISNVMTLCI